MAWDETKNFGDLIRKSDWNDMVSVQKKATVGSDKLIADIGVNLPVAGEGQRLFFEIDTGRILYDNGSSWVPVGVSEGRILLPDINDSNHSTLSGLTPSNHHVKTTDMDDMDDIKGVTSFEEDNSGGRPAAGTEGRIFFETDTGRVLYDNGVSWIELSVQVVELSNIDKDVSNQRIFNLAEGTNPQDLITKSFMDNIEETLTLKDAVRVATDGSSIDLASSTDPSPVDGVSLADGDRILLKDQTDATENGIYDAVTASDPSTWVRSEGFNEDAEVISGSFTFIEEGTVNNNSGYVIITADPITLGTTSIEWTQFSGSGAIGAGEGLILNGDTLKVGVDIDDDGVDVIPGYGIDFAGADFSVSNEADDTVSVSLTDSSVDVAGNNVLLGGSTGVKYTDLSDTGTSFPIPNSDLANTDFSFAGNNVSLSGSATVDYVDLSDTGTSFPIPNSELSNTTFTVAGSTINLGGGQASFEVDSFSGSEGVTGQVIQTDGGNLDYAFVDEAVKKVSSDYTTNGETTIVLESIADVTLSTTDAESGKIVRVQDGSGSAGSTPANVFTEGSELINGESSAVIDNDFESLSFQSDGSDWFIISRQP